MHTNPEPQSPGNPGLSMAIQIKPTENETSSYFGGYPPQYSDFKWPERAGCPMGFLACIDLGALPAMIDWLPKVGSLLFFYDVNEWPWGAYVEDRDGWAVLYIDHPIGPNAPEAAAPPALRPEDVQVRRGMRFRAAVLPNSCEDSPSVLESEINDAWQLLCDLANEGPLHLIAGLASPIQDHDLQMECQLLSNGIKPNHYGESDDPRIMPLKAGAKDWKPLLQIDSDHNLNVMWGDMGQLSFLVRAGEARKGDFSNVWAFVDCH